MLLLMNNMIEKSLDESLMSGAGYGDDDNFSSDGDGLDTDTELDDTDLDDTDLEENVRRFDDDEAPLKPRRMSTLGPQKPRGRRLPQRGGEVVGSYSPGGRRLNKSRSPRRRTRTENERPLAVSRAGGYLSSSAEHKSQSMQLAFAPQHWLSAAVTKNHRRKVFLFFIIVYDLILSYYNVIIK